MNDTTLNFENVAVAAFRHEYKLKEKKEEGWFTKYKDVNAYRRYSKYFDEIANVLFVKEYINHLKIGSQYEFKVGGYEKLKDLMIRYRQIFKNEFDRMDIKSGKKRTTNLKKQVIYEDQFNALVSERILEDIVQISDVNEFIIRMIECFKTLFLEAGIDAYTVDNIMCTAINKYSYYKRLFYRDSFNIIKWYFEEIIAINKKRGGEHELSERENYLWIKYANSQIDWQMHEVFRVREMMQKRIEYDVQCDAYKSLKESNISEVEKSLHIENYIIELCLEDLIIQDKINKYFEITDQELNLNKMVWLVYEVEEGITDRDLLYYLKQVFEIPFNGESSIKKDEIKELENILIDIFNFIRDTKNKYGFEILKINTECKRLRNEELLNHILNINQNNNENFNETGR